MDNVLNTFKNIGIFSALYETLLMIIISTLISFIVGLLISLVSILTAKDGLKPNKLVYHLTSFIINLGRSIPFIILLVVLIPFTRFIVGTSIGVRGMIVPLTLGSIPFVARVCEDAFLEVDKGLIGAIKAMGAKNTTILYEVYIKESLPSLIRGIGLTMIMLVGYSAMSGAVGGGGLGGLAITYGYYKFDSTSMFMIVIMIVLMVQVIQKTFDLVSKKIDKR